jgi:hypothetical protein
MLETLINVYGAVSVLALLAVAVHRGLGTLRRRAELRKALQFCRRAADGTVYVTDPQTGTAHRLDDLLSKRVLGDRPSVSSRQQRKVRRRVQQLLGAR